MQKKYNYTLEKTTKQVLSFLHKNVQTSGVYLMGEKGVDEAYASSNIFTRRLSNAKRD